MQRGQITAFAQLCKKSSTTTTYSTDVVYRPSQILFGHADQPGADTLSVFVATIAMPISDLISPIASYRPATVSPGHAQHWMCNKQSCGCEAKNSATTTTTLTSARGSPGEGEEHKTRSIVPPPDTRSLAR